MRLNYFEKPKLKRPLLVAGFPGIAHIAKLGVEYLVHELQAKNFLELYSDYFPEWVVRDEGLAKPMKVDFYHCRPNGLKRDLVLATANAQAASQFGQYALTSEILDAAEQCKVDTLVTIAAYVLSPHESRAPVVGVATSERMLKMLHEHGIESLGGGMIVGMNGLLPAFAAQRGIEGACLLGATHGGLLDVDATRAVLRCLAELFGFKLNLENLPQYTSKVPSFMPPKFRLPEVVEEEVSYIL